MTSPRLTIAVALLAFWGGAAPFASGDKVGQWIGPAFSGAASTTVADESGNARTGTLTGGDNTSTLQSTDRPGTAGTHSLHFNGTDDYVALPNLATFMGDNASVMAWLKLDVATPATAPPTGLWNTGPAITSGASHHPFTDGFGYYSAFRATNNTTLSRVNSVNLSAGGTRTSWHHVAITTSPGANGWKLWIDGVQITSTTGTTGVYYDSDLWSFGRSFDGTTSYFFDGYIWDCRIYNTNEAANLAAIMAEKDSGVVSPLPRIIQLLFSDRRTNQQKHFETYGVYALSP